MEEVGKVEHYFGRIEVAAIEMTSGSLSIGDTVKFKGHTTDFEQQIECMQVENEPVESVTVGQHVGIKVGQKVREGDSVFKVVQE
jgi:hypothetical protein